MTFHRALKVAAAAAALAVLPIASAQAQDFPSRPITVSIGVPAGGALHVLMQAIGAEFEKKTGQPMVIEPKPGANTIIQLNACKSAAPDGYTLCLASRSGIAINPFVYENLSYDPLKDFTFITNVMNANHFYMVRADLPVESWDDLVKYAKANPEAYNYGSFGAGGDSHLFAAWLANEAGAKMTHIPYRGFAPLSQAFAANEIQGLYLLMGNPSILDQYRNKEIKALMVSGDKRHPMMPDVPSMVEIGLPADIAGIRGYFGLCGPAGIPDAVVAKLNSVITDILKDPAFVEKYMTPNALDPDPMSATEFKKKVEDDMVVAKKLVEVAGVKLKQN